MEIFLFVGKPINRKMTELKTLKDIDFVMACTDPMGEEDERAFVDKNQLRQEAIKWIKEIINFSKSPDDYLYEAITQNVITYSEDGKAAIINWIKHFFNITESDLQ